MYSRESVCVILKDYRNTGVTVFKKDDSWFVTHPQGDSHAEDIVNGEITLADALNDERERQIQLRRMRRQ